jgi:protein tyrosine phosphatase (PTP) superfamily phosphohydrolase (DUF442 family)
MTKRMRILLTYLLLVLLPIGAYAAYEHLTYQFETISKGKVYKSGAMPPEVLLKYVKKYGIKTVIDLRHQDLHDKLNPGTITEIMAEQNALDALEDVEYVHIPSGQTPSKKTLTDFFKVLDRKDAYPVLIHCHHGMGRAHIYSAIYRIEYEAWSPEDAREKTRIVLEGSSFDKGRSKGEFLIHYQSRNSGKFDQNRF